MDRNGDDTSVSQDGAPKASSELSDASQQDRLQPVSPEVTAAMQLMHERICKSIADPKRLLMLHALRRGELNVGELAEVLSISQPNASQHIAVLRDRGIVLPRREGTTIYYRLASERIIDAIDLMWSFLEEGFANASPAPGAASLIMKG
jgi:ArsR family transcriptional regulator